jgi:exoribonuclease R
MHHLSQKLIANRKKRGAIDFDSLEVQIDLTNKVCDLFGSRQRLDSHRLIEGLCCWRMNV